MKKNLFKIMAILVMLVSQAYAQDRTITGQVKSKDDGFPLPGVSVKLKSSKVGTTTGADGRYTLRIPAGQGSVLVFSFIGFNPIEKTVTGNSVDVMLSENANSLQEVAVVSAGGILRTPKEQGYAATRVTAEQLTSGKSTTVAGGLQAKVPGLQINATGSGANPAYRLVLRGNRSISGNNQALIVLDNVVVPNALLGNINPEDVEDIQVLNGASGAALYGSDASNGALIITTKKGKNGQNCKTALVRVQLQAHRYTTQLKISNTVLHLMAQPETLVEPWLMVQSNLLHTLQPETNMISGTQVSLTKQISLCLLEMINLLHLFQDNMLMEQVLLQKTNTIELPYDLMVQDNYQISFPPLTL
jgi:TonB-dependent SusC/RagA subfamily outer membrane receptor